MIHIRTQEEIETMRRCGKANAEIHAALQAAVRPGVTTTALDETAREAMRQAGVTSSIEQGYGFPGSICISVNDEVGHGVPGPYVVHSGDLVTFDVSVQLDGYHTDAAVTLQVGEDGDVHDTPLTEATEASLWAGVNQARAGNRCSDISHAIYTEARRHGLDIVRHAFGHGIGEDLHETPQIANFGPPGYGPRLRPGMVLAIEPVATAGRRYTRKKRDGWTEATVDGKLSAHFEHTILITDGDPEVLTVSQARKQKDALAHNDNKIRFRPMVETDRNLVLQMATEEMDGVLMEAWGRRVQPAEIFDPAGHFVILEHVAAGPVGFYVWAEHREAIHLNTLVITRAYQRQGLGRRVMDELEHVVRERGKQALTLCVQTNNTKAIRFYERLGFRNGGSAEVNTWLFYKRL